MPLFGLLELAGKTRDEASAYVEERLSESYFDPRVAVIVQEFNNNNVFLLGAFQWPGEYKLENQATLLHRPPTSGSSKPRGPRPAGPRARPPWRGR